MTEPIGAMRLPPGHTVIREGDVDAAIYVLRQGILEVIKGDVVVAEISEPGSFFGEMSAILGRPRTATVRTKTQADVVHVAQGLDRLIEAHPRLCHVLMHSFAARLAETSDRFVTGKLSGI